MRGNEEWKSVMLKIPLTSILSPNWWGEEIDNKIYFGADRDSLRLICGLEYFSQRPLTPSFTKRGNKNLVGKYRYGRFLIKFSPLKIKRGLRGVVRLLGFLLR